MKAEELKSKTPDQLRDSLVQLKKEAFNLRFQQATNQLENTARMRAVRRDVARIKTVLNQKAHEVHIDLAARRVHRVHDGARDEIKLTPTEFKLLGVLAQHPGKVLTHALLLREVWGPGHDADFAYLRVYMGQLRHKLEVDPTQPRWLLTELGVGYRLQDEASL